VRYGMRGRLLQYTPEPAGSPLQCVRTVDCPQRGNQRLRHLLSLGTSKSIMKRTKTSRRSLYSETSVSWPTGSRASIDVHIGFVPGQFAPKVEHDDPLRYPISLPVYDGLIRFHMPWRRRRNV
jgi:hypothetical protein